MPVSLPGPLSTDRVGSTSCCLSSPWTPHLASFYKSPLDINPLKKKRLHWTSLVVQWLRIHLPMQGTWVWSLFQKDPSCHRATKPECHNYWARVLHLQKPARSGACPLQEERPLQWEAQTPRLESSLCSPQREKAHTRQWRPSTAINKLIKRLHLYWPPRIPPNFWGLTILV